MCKHILDTTGVVVSEATICRLPRRHGFTRKKIRHVALQHSTELRALFMAQALSFPREFFVWVDETGSDARNYMRKFGFSLRGIRAECHRILVHGERISAVAAISSDGLTAVKLKKGTVDADYFVDFLRGSLVPNMLPFDGTNPKSIAIMDNCSIPMSRLWLIFLMRQGYSSCSFLPIAQTITPLKKPSVTSRVTSKSMTQSCKYWMIPCL